MKVEEEATQIPAVENYYGLGILDLSPDDYIEIAKNIKIGGCCSTGWVMAPASKKMEPGH